MLKTGYQTKISSILNEIGWLYGDGWIEKGGEISDSE